MGKRSAAGELFLGNMGSIQREIRPSIQREDQLTMETKLEQNSSECCEPTAEERSAANPHATFCGSRRRVTSSGDPVGGQQ
jgi:RNA-directed DNA polymerase